MKYRVYGPFELWRNGRDLDTQKGWKKRFWDSVRDEESDLPEACGCYMFAIKSGKGALPWYIGCTTKRGFKDEVLCAHQMFHYSHAMRSKNKGIPQIFFIAKVTPSGRFSKPGGNAHKDTAFLEKFLLGLAFKRNTDIRNSNDTSMLRDLVVPGIFNSPQGKRTRAELDLKSIVGAQH